MGMLLSCVLLYTSHSWLTLEVYNVQNNATAAIHCTAQNYGRMVSTRYISVLTDTVVRNAGMLNNHVVSSTLTSGAN